MIYKFRVIFIFLLLLGGTAGWSHYLRLAGQPASIPSREKIKSEEAPNPTAKRRELLETLDRLVAYQHYYRSVNGHFTRLLSKTGISLPKSVSEDYEISVTEANGNSLLMVALSESDRGAGDFVSVDQDFRIHANFEIPLPRAEYLRSQAFKHIRAIREARGDYHLSEASIFQGFFKYEIKKGSQGQQTVFAEGVRIPVLGYRIEAGSESQPADGSYSGLVDEQGAFGPDPTTGESPARHAFETLEEAFLAQKIFRGEVGRYAKSWNELSRITDFNFDEVERVPATASKEQRSYSAEVSPPTEKTDSVSQDITNGLVIEPILDAEAK